MKMKAKSQKGFTLVELMIAIVTSAILVLAAGIVLVIGQEFWNEALKKANLQRDASYALINVMSRSIKAGASAQVEAGGKALRIRIGDSNSIFSHVEGTHNLQYQIGSEQPQTIINGKVESLQFNVQDNKVTIDLRLKEDDAQIHFVSTVMMRNCGV